MSFFLESTQMKCWPLTMIFCPTFLQTAVGSAGAAEADFNPNKLKRLVEATSAETFSTDLRLVTGFFMKRSYA